MGLGSAVALSGSGTVLVACAPEESNDATGVDNFLSNNFNRLSSGACYVITRTGAVWRSSNYIK